jgi:hypothetical protein
MAGTINSTNLLRKEEMNKKSSLSQVEDFIVMAALPAFKEIAAKLQNEGKEVLISSNKKYAIIKIRSHREWEFGFKIIPRITKDSAYPLGVAVYRNKDDSIDEEICSLQNISNDDLIQKILDRYNNYNKLISHELSAEKQHWLNHIRKFYRFWS